MTFTRQRPWKNWAGDESCVPRNWLQPSSVEGVAEAVRQATRAGQSLRVVGAGHSFGDLVCTDGLLLNLDRLTGIRQVDPAAGLVTVGAGTRLFDLNPLLAARGLALANLGDIDRQSVAGAVSTGTHGTGRLLGNLATQIESLEIVLADGSVRFVGPEDLDTLKAARISLGSLGVITAYTLRVVPAFTLRARTAVVPREETVSRLDEFVDDNDHFEFFLLPHADAVLAKFGNRTGEPASPPRPKAQFASEFVENSVFDAACRVGRRFPTKIPRINQTITRLLGGSEYVGDSYRVFASKRSVKFTEMEWSVPREACAEVLSEIQRVIQTRGFDVNFPIEVRFVAGDTESFLSPVYGRESAYLAVHMYRGMAWRPYFQAVQEIALAHEGRPHWGKRHLLTADQLAGRYPEWDAFQKVRAELDPEGVFTNEHIARVLGPVGA